MKPYFGLRGGWLTFWVTVACATDMVCPLFSFQCILLTYFQTLFGYDQGVFGGVIVTDDFLDTLGLQGPENTGTVGTVTAIYDIGCFFGAVIAFWLGEQLGRKKTIIVGTAIMTVGAILQISAYSVAQMIVGRIIAGIGNGINTVRFFFSRCQILLMSQGDCSCLAIGNISNQMARKTCGY
jgi:MFS family permease